MDDARVNVSLALTAASYGATVANHVSVVSIEKDSSGVARFHFPCNKMTYSIGK